MYTALVVDDHPFIRSTVCMLLRQEHLEVVGQATMASMACAWCASTGLTW